MIAAALAIRECWIFLRLMLHIPQYIKKNTTSTASISLTSDLVEAFATADKVNCTA